ncbi:MAG: VWA domain-containing protein [Planctomycetaceae bacterium]|nr:VWA domain-containing protein [Planctomycetaceae bacterium]
MFLKSKDTVISCIGSLIFHVILGLLLLLYFAMLPEPPSAPGDRNAVGGIVLAGNYGEETAYTDGSSDDGTESERSKDNPSLEEGVGIFSEIDLRDTVANISAIGRGNPNAGAVPNAAAMAGSLQGSGAGFGGSRGGKTNVRVFGTEGRASSFVYVFDRSGSMNEFSGRPIRAAKKELIKSIEPLEAVHKFNIIFYNEKPLIWKPGRALVFANDINKVGAERFVEGTVSSGGTNHSAALMEALSLSPEVIFFLTDGDENDAISPGDQEAITKRNNNSVGAQINVIQFGVGAKRESGFLKKLAAQNRGQYVYVNVAEL